MPAVSGAAQDTSSFDVLVSSVTLAGLPEGGPPLQFRCHLSSRSPGGELLLEQFTQPRTQPDWLVKYQHQGAGPLSVDVHFRPGPGADWISAGEVEAQPREVLGAESGAIAEIALTTCRFAPDLRVQLQFSVTDTSSATTNKTLSPIKGMLPIKRNGAANGNGHATNGNGNGHVTNGDGPSSSGRAHKSGAPNGDAQQEVVESGTPQEEEARVESHTEAEALAAVMEAPELSAPEKVIVKDTWNKLLAFHELLVEIFFERLLHEEPELIEVFGDAIDNVPDDFAGLFDKAVRELTPQTENILRESYRNVPGLAHMECNSVEEFVTLLTDLGMRPKHWLTARKVWVWMLGEIPYLEEYERENIRRGTASAPYKFFSRHIVRPALEAARAYDEALSPEIIQEMGRCGDALAENARTVGIEFYRLMFARSPETMKYFGRTDMDHLADHLFKSIQFLTTTLRAGDNALGSLRHLAAVHTEFMVPPEAYDALTPPMMEVMRRYYPGFSDELELGWRVLLQRVIHILAQPMINRRRLLSEARKWLDLIAGEQEWPQADKDKRWSDIEREVRATGVYTHTYEELAYGAQVAWRNAPKCIARISWRNMIVRDLRHVNDPDEMFRECAEHVRMGINGGNMQIVMNVFRPKRPKERWGPRVWNSQYLRYAGYPQPDGTIIGDGANVKLTEAIERLGWERPEKLGHFDLLPLVIEVPGQAPRMYTFDPKDAAEVEIEHPTIPGFKELGLKWVPIPAISNFRMDIGGIQYGCIPFNGWFMETEIARNLWEGGRYNQAENIARVMGLDTSSEQTLWRDRAFLELNAAVLHSFSKAKVSLVDHQTASRQFMAHDLREKKAGRECPAQWSWVVPAAGGSSTPVWHHEMRDFYLSPHYHYAADKWAVLGEEIEFPEEAEAEEGGSGIVILYGSETGTAEGFARQTARRLQMHRPRVMALDECDPIELAQESMVLIITSTFGEGDLPGNAKRFGKRIKEMSRGALTDVKYSVLALGSTIYPHFCAAGAMLDREMVRLGANRAVALHRGDELKGQGDTFHQWLDLVARLLGEDPTAANTAPTAWPRARFIEAPSERPASTRPGFEAPIVASRELLKEVIPGSRSTRFIAFDVSASDTKYETGDHLSVYPRNPQAEVERLCKRLNVDPEAWFVTEMADASGKVVEGETAWMQPTQVRQVITEEFDLSLREPLQELLKTLAEAAGDAGEKTKLTEWVETLSRGDQEETEHAAVLTQSILDSHLSINDLLDEFPSCTLELGRLIELLPRQKPRLYSISSSSLLHPEQVQVTIGVVQVKTAAGKTRPGLCSNYLASLDPERGDTARISVRKSTFRPPTELQTPMLMVGPGTGLSPLIGFLQHRGAQLRQEQEAGAETSLGNARLYFGCRDNNDFLYQNELESWRDEGVLTHLAVAFSRASEKKTYVQHLIADHGEEIWQVLSAPRCHYYICGDAKMADDVFDALMVVAQRIGGLTRGAAIDFFDQMKSEKRFHADVWGITLNFAKAIQEVRQDKYGQGEKWLRQVNAAETDGDKKADQLVGAEGVAVTSA